MEKRKPLLADRLLHSDLYTHANVKGTQGYRMIMAAQELLRTTHRFVLDNEASAFVGRMIGESPRVIADAQDFAIPPFRQMWIEFSMRDFYPGVTGRQIDEWGDTTVGYLYDGPAVYVASYAPAPDHDGPGVGFMPIRYILNRPMDVQRQLYVADMLGCSRLGIDSFLWGESFNKFLDYEGPAEVLKAALNAETVEDYQAALGHKEAMRALRQHDIDLIFDSEEIRRKEIDTRGMYHTLYNTSAGDLRNILAMLIFINRTQHVQRIVDVPFQRGRMINRRPATLLRHSVISLKLDPLPMLRKLSANVGEGNWRRLHDVRGHFCHDRRAREAPCQHEVWEEYEPLRWKCPRCGGHRWWRREHQRGHLDKGVVAQEYAVTK